MHWISTAHPFIVNQTSFFSFFTSFLDGELSFRETEEIHQMHYKSATKEDLELKGADFFFFTPSYFSRFNPFPFSP